MKDLKVKPAHVLPALGVPRLSPCQALTAFVLAFLLVGCGGGGGGTPDAATPASAEPAPDTRKSALRVVGNTPATGGAWSAPFSMQLVAIHLTLQPDGRVMYFGSNVGGTDQSAISAYGVWDPMATNPADGVQVLPNLSGSDIFCSSSILTPSGQIFIAGGDLPNAPGMTWPYNAANPYLAVFDPVAKTLVRRADMKRPRWYASTAVTMDGEVYIQGGNGGGDYPEVRQADGTSRLLSGVNTDGFMFGAQYVTYPSIWVGPDGNLFGLNGDYMYNVDPRGTGRYSNVAKVPGFWNVKAAMFRPGHLFTMNYDATSKLFDLNRGTPRITSAEAFDGVRAYGFLTVLADGRVAVTGGTNNGGLSGAAYTAEVWNPTTGEFTTGPSMKNARLYHSTALLLPDARVLVAGGGLPGPVTQTNGEIYSPPYLFDAQGRLAPRPAITQAPSVLNPGQVFRVASTASRVSRVTFVRAGSATHNFNLEQRMLDLPFAQDPSGDGLTVTLPSRAPDTPPGFYMLFVFNEQGVPSVARMVRVNTPTVSPPQQPPVLADLPDRTTAPGQAVVIRAVASSPRNAPLRYLASGLPAGVQIDPATGILTGAPTAAGTYYVHVSAHDGTWAAGRSFVWQVQTSNVVLPEVTTSGPGVVGQALSFTARSAAAGQRYSWSFGDGSPVTAWSTTPSISYTYRTPGVYSVVLTVMGVDGLPRTSSFLQSVGRPVVGTPQASSQLASSGSGGAGRVWMVNPDADSVAVFNTSTRQRVAEVPVEERPGSVAIASTGQAWVSNRGGDSLTVIDPGSLTRAARVALPAGSQPYGLVADRDRNRIFVVLEGSGQLLRLDASSRAVTGSLALGAGVRHVSLSADGATLWVTRFITPALPGESTARVEPNQGGTVRGGEVLVVNAASMTLTRRVVLRHGDLPDGENQGRGIPNYVGAAALSPDNSQAWVPSKQDNVLRGTLRDGRNLDFQNTVRAISSRIDMATLAETPELRIDHDNASLASAAGFDPSGVWLYVALETSREIAVIDAHRGMQRLRLNTGFAPQGVLVSEDGTELYVANFMSRELGIYDLSKLRLGSALDAPQVASVPAVAAEPLPPAVALGKRLFYDAKDTRLSRESYMSCASCHSDGGHDGRTWDLTGFGEGLRNTPTLRGKAGMGQGRLHWSGNFDEVQDFEGQIRALAGGTGLIANGVPNAPLGAPNAGRSADLDALAAYVSSLSKAQPSAGRAGNGVLTGQALWGAEVFAANCVQCHGGSSGSSSGRDSLHNVGTQTAASGRRLNAVLNGIDVPGLDEIASSAPYLHDGSAATLEQAVQRHSSGLTAADLAAVAAFLRQADLARDVPLTRLSHAPRVFAAGAAQDLGDGVFRLTKADYLSGASAMWATHRWSTTQSFSTEFNVSLTGPAAQAAQADGIAFVLQAGAGGVGPGAQHLGWEGLPGALAARLLTWNYNLAGLAIDGRPTPAAGFNMGAAKSITGKMVVRYDAAQTRLSMQADLVVDGVPRQVRDSAVVDLAARFGPTMRAGLTAGTGGAVAEQVVSGWTVRFGSNLQASDTQVAGGAVMRDSGDALLTREQGGPPGLLAAQQRWSTNTSFDTRFNVRMVRGVHPAMADGVSFALHSGAADAVGNGGGCLGSCDLPNAVRASLLTWEYNLGGLSVGGAGPVKPLGFDLGRARDVSGTVRVRYDAAAKRMTMRADLWLDGVARTFEDSLAIDLKARFGDSMTAAITSATGGATGTHTVSDWTVDFGSEVVTTPLLGAVVSAPACVESNSGTGRVDCLGVGTDGKAYTQSWVGERWTGWAKVGGSFTPGQAPSCNSWGNNQTLCYLRGTDGALWYAGNLAGSWTLGSMGGVITSAASCTAARPGELLCMVRGADNAAYSQYYAAGVWSGWRRHGGTMTSNPSCVSNGDHLNCFWRGAAGDLQHMWLVNGRQESAPTSLGGAILGAPSCVRGWDGNSACYARGVDNALYEIRWLTHFWGGWTQVPGSPGLVAETPACSAGVSKATQCTVRLADGSLRSVASAAGSLAGADVSWRHLGASSAQEPPVCLQRGAQGERAECTYRRTDAAPVHLGWSLPMP